MVLYRKLYINKENMKIVLIWASNNSEKYGNKILKDLVSKWNIVMPVNPKEETIEGIRTYKTLSDIKEKFDIVNFVIKPKITLKILEDNLELLKDKKIWCQPWASNDQVKSFLEENDFSDYIVDSCIMLRKIA